MNSGERTQSSAAIAITTATAALILGFTGSAQAHHGFGMFEMDKLVDYSGTLTKVELVNPHSYIYFTMEKNGKPYSMRCSMRSATLLRRSGWNVDFEPGMHVHVLGHPHREDPHSCYLESVTLGGNATKIGRNEQFTKANVNTANRAATLPSGVPNITGDWAVEEYVLTIPPSGGSGAMVPKHLVNAYHTGKISLEQIRAQYPRPERPVYTDAGKAAAKAFDRSSPTDNPRFSCNTTSIIFDWTFDWPVNRIRQHTLPDGQRVIDMTYGSYSSQRRIYMDMDHHPANVEPSREGHSIGHWEGNTLVVDTIGFKPGVLVPPTRNSDKLHIVERYTVDTDKWSIKRDYTVTDPVYLAQPYHGSDTVYLSNTPYQKVPCKELTYEFMKHGGRRDD